MRNTYFCTVIIFGLAICVPSLPAAETEETEERSTTSSALEMRYVYPRVRDLSKSSGSGELEVHLHGSPHNWTLVLQLNRMVVGSALVHEIHHANGKRRVKHDRTDLCHYHGFVEGRVGSWVAVSTCHGVDGAFSDGKYVYIVEPAKRSAKLALSRAHAVYKREDDKTEKSCGVTEHSTDKEQIRPLHIHADERLFYGHRRQLRQTSTNIRYIELLLVVDTTAYNRIGGAALAKTFVLNVANFLDRVYKPLGIRVVLTSAIYWTSSNQITVSPDPQVTLNAFSEYRRTNWIKNSRYPNDDAQLVTGVDFTGSTVGRAGINTICSPTAATGVNEHKAGSYTGVAYTMAHELGHNLNMNHDDGRRCDNCTLQKCIMAGSSGPSSSNAFSQCSSADLQSLFSSGGGPCLDNVPTQTFGDAVCGNGLVETGEQCDCGTVQECRDPCCNATTCGLTSGSECANGDCCKNCRFQPATFRCRATAGECDIAEYCSGTSGNCPNNLVKSSGTSCNAGQAYCWDGECRTITKQCQTLWGQSATIADQRCYPKFNVRGDNFGNCGNDSSGYVKCAASDVLCGLLQCSTSAPKPIIGTSWRSNTWTYRGPQGSYSCRTASVDLGDDIPDPGLALDGIFCGSSKVCENRHCILLSSATAVRAQQCPLVAGQRCSSSTVCSNVGTCVNPNGPISGTTSSSTISTTGAISPTMAHLSTTITAASNTPEPSATSSSSSAASNWTVTSGSSSFVDWTFARTFSIVSALFAAASLTKMMANTQ